jgi:hypothetical protein
MKMPVRVLSNEVPKASGALMRMACFLYTYGFKKRKILFRIIR